MENVNYAIFGAFALVLCQWFRWRRSRLDRLSFTQVPSPEEVPIDDISQATCAQDALDAEPDGNRKDSQRKEESAQLLEPEEVDITSVYGYKPIKPILRLEVVVGCSELRTIRTAPETSKVRLGRAPGNDLVLPQNEISAKHCTITWDADQLTWMLMDVGSLNGTSLNNTLISLPDRKPGERHRLSDGDHVKLGIEENCVQIAVQLVTNVEDRRPEAAVAEQSPPPQSTIVVRDRNENWGSIPRNYYKQTVDRAQITGIGGAAKARGPDIRFDAMFRDPPPDGQGSVAESTPEACRPPAVAQPGKYFRVPYGIWARKSLNQTQAMEDRAYVECPLRGHDRVALFCIFDGHCGPNAAERAKALLPEKIATLLDPKGVSEEGAAEVLQKAFLQTDEEILCDYCGCTATVMLVWVHKGQIYSQVANVGDSAAVRGDVVRAVAAEGGEARQGVHNVAQLSGTHSLKEQSERQRLIEHGVLLRPGENRLYGLNVSRALGDKYLKGEEVGLTAVPSVSTPLQSVTKCGTFVVLASDGLWDFLPQRQVISEPLFVSCSLVALPCSAGPHFKDRFGVAFALMLAFLLRRAVGESNNHWRMHC
ncbi:hypothetical protein CYMTET_50791 [Cymbomonas tetramitiformis]|uniref:Protein-serine/threonine phosphatase n=1 Tax=Cymbomonas tetramitiformis TaxID=36881 RepID=A0AAE0ETB7_9CHLO|nr:hypothetical protein CYMTET_50791 [Cymbomonas tetramitiformis]